jgi:nitrate/nitrite transport system ATP-binding protein
MITLITHDVDADVDETALLADRIGMPRNVPSAAIGELLDADLPRPRKRLEHGGRPTDTKGSSGTATASREVARWRSPPLPRRRDAVPPWRCRWPG